MKGVSPALAGKFRWAVFHLNMPKPLLWDRAEIDEWCNEVYPISWFKKFLYGPLYYITGDYIFFKYYDDAVLFYMTWVYDGWSLSSEQN